MESRVDCRRLGTTHWGFPSTLNQGKKVAIYGDNDPAIENSALITKQDFLQSSIQSLRASMKDQGGGGASSGNAHEGKSFADK